MTPLLQPKSKVLVAKFLPLAVGNIISLYHPLTRQILLKRIVKKKKNKFWVAGDNKNESTDSRDFGWIERKDIIGKVIYKKS